MQNKKQLFIDFALKYQVSINIAFFLGITLYLYFTISWDLAFNILLDIPNYIVEILSAIFTFLATFLSSFYHDITTFPTNLKIISVGILKRFLFEDIIFPLLAKFYFNIIKEDMILYYKLKYREFKKFPLILRTAISSPFALTVISVISYFKILSIVFLAFQKVFTNTIFSKMKFIVIKWIPALWIVAVDVPIISLIIDYFALVKIISLLKKIRFLRFIYILKYFRKILQFFDRKIIIIQNYLHGNIGLYLRNKAILKKFKTRNKIDLILKENIADYHVLSVGYDNTSFKKKVLRLKKWREIRKNNKKLKRKRYILILRNRIFSMFKTN